MPRTRSLFPLLVLLLGAAAAPAAGPAEDPFSIDLDVREATLENGLRVLLVPRPGDPRVACRVVYGVGSVNERPGITGISHLLEHMMFKGTERIGVKDAAADREMIARIDAAHAAWKAARAKDGADAAATARASFDALVRQEKELIEKDELWRLYTTAGATGLNAFTSQDITAYIVTLPANRVELFFWLEADRMANAVMREFHSEREVVKEERRLRTVNTPTGPFEETLNALAYTAHPYRWPVVGWMSDLDAITRRDLDEYRAKYYTPRNAVVCLAGGLDADRCLKLAKRYFGGIPAGPEPPRPATVEPPQEGRRRLDATARAAPQVRILWHVPAFDHPDLPALEVLAGILSGETGRLSDRLVRELGIARSARADVDRQLYPSLFSMSATAAGDVDPETLLPALGMEVRRLKNEAPGAEEVERARNQIAARSVRSLRRVGWLSVGLAAAELRGNWRDVVEYPKKVLAVTPEDVRRVAKTYLVDENSTVGVLRRAEEVKK